MNAAITRVNFPVRCSNNHSVTEQSLHRGHRPERSLRVPRPRKPSSERLVETVGPAHIPVSSIAYRDVVGRSGSETEGLFLEHTEMRERFLPLSARLRKTLTWRRWRFIKRDERTAATTCVWLPMRLERRRNGCSSLVSITYIYSQCISSHAIWF